MIKDKVGQCVKRYGEIADEELMEENDDIAWRKILDIQMFVMAICFTLNKNSDERPKEYHEVLDCLEGNYIRLKRNSLKQEQCYRITDCPNETDFPTKSDFSEEQVYLRLCLNAFMRADTSTLDVVKCFFGAKYNKEVAKTEKISGFGRERLEKSLKEDWPGMVVRIYGTRNLKGRNILNRHCEKVKCYLVELSEPNRIF